MRQSPERGDNRTGLTRSGRLGEQMLEATREFRPSSPGSAQALAEVRIAYAQEGESLGEASPPASPRGEAGSAVTGGQPTRLMDKLGERLAFERAGARLYEALLSKHEAYGSFDGGPSAQDLLHILQEEYEHADLVQRAIEDLGGDPTVVTPSASLAVAMSAGLPQVLSDPRAGLLQSLEAIAVAELADNECWSALEGLARQAGHDALAEQCLDAVEREREHLGSVRRWVAAGQGRAMVAGGGAPLPGTETEFTFVEDTSTDAEGYVISEEETLEAGETRARPRSGKSGKGKGKGKSSGRKRSS